MHHLYRLLIPDVMTDPLLRLHTETVRPEWIDYNGHMNVAYYVLAFDHATDRLLDQPGSASPMWRRRTVGFVLEMHVTYEREVTEGDPLTFTTRILDVDAKRVHLFHAMHHGTEGWLAATNELVLMHIDLEARRSCPLPDIGAGGAGDDPPIPGGPSPCRSKRAG